MGLHITWPLYPLLEHVAEQIGGDGRALDGRESLNHDRAIVLWQLRRSIQPGPLQMGHLQGHSSHIQRQIFTAEGSYPAANIQRRLVSGIAHLLVPKAGLLFAD